MWTRGQVNKGNGYAEIVRDGSNVPVKIIPVRPHRVTPEILRNDDESQGLSRGDLIYHVAFDLSDKTSSHDYSEPELKVPCEDMLDMRSKLTKEGITGIGVIQQAREGIGLGIQAERFGANYYGTMGMPRVVVNMLSKMGPEDQKRFRKQWSEIYGSKNNPEDIAILPGGEAKLHILDLNPNDADLLNTRKFTVEEIARWYGLPPHLLQLISSSSSASLEQLGVEFVNYSLMPWLKRQEEELMVKLLTEEDLRAGIQIRYDVDNLQKRGSGFPDVCLCQNDAVWFHDE